MAHRLFLGAPPSTEQVPLSLHDALPISARTEGREGGEEELVHGGAVRHALGLHRQRADEPLAVAPESVPRSEEHTSELQSQSNLVCRLLLEKKNNLAWRPARRKPAQGAP